VILVIDNYDSFTYNLVAYLEELGQEVLVLKNDQSLENVNVKALKGILLSPGPDLPEDSNGLMGVIKLFQGKLPILGICLGMQALVVYNGGLLTNLDKPYHGKVSTVKVKGNGLYKNVPNQIDVVRYHSWIVDKLPINFNITAETLEGDIMSFENELLMIDGVQYHPESILTRDGKNILANWLRKRNIIQSF